MSKNSKNKINIGEIQREDEILHLVNNVINIFIAIVMDIIVR
jgi:hypothetical protein